MSVRLEQKMYSGGNGQVRKKDVNCFKEVLKLILFRQLMSIRVRTETKSVNIELKLSRLLSRPSSLE